MTNTKKNRGLNIGLWVVQCLLAAMFIMAGVMKSSQPIEELVKSVHWASDIPTGLVRFIGVSELFGGIGLLLPSLLRIRPGLTPLAALGLAVIMLLALAYHISKGEFSLLWINISLGAAALFVAWGRSRKVPIVAKAS